jgi:hypothetical protein
MLHRSRGDSKTPYYEAGNKPKPARQDGRKGKRGGKLKSENESHEIYAEHKARDGKSCAPM